MFEKEESTDKTYVIYLKSLIRGIILSIILLIIGSIIFYFTNLSEGYMKTFIWIMTVMSICYSSIYGTVKIGRKGYLHGGAIGGIYTIILSVVAFLAEKGQLNIRTYIILFVMSLVVGALSGMIVMVLSNRE
jgi:putative membrane protein (TIGR04086 family)